AAHERHGEGALVDVVDVVGGGEDLGLVDAVDAQLLEDLRLHDVTDPGLRHDGDVDGGDDLVDEVRVAHAGHAALCADVRGHPLERHDGDGTGLGRDAGLLGRDDVHDDSAGQRRGELDGGGRGCGGLGPGGLRCHALPR